MNLPALSYERSTGHTLFGLTTTRRTQNGGPVYGDTEYSTRTAR